MNSSAPGTPARTAPRSGSSRWRTRGSRAVITHRRRLRGRPRRSRCAVVRVPARPHHPVPVADQLVDAVLLGDGAQVVEDHRPVGQRAVARPRPPAEAEGEHVGVGADARVAEQVPGAAAGLARLEHRHGLRRAGARAAGRPRRSRTGRRPRSVRRRARGRSSRRQTICDMLSRQPTCARVRNPRAPGKLALVRGCNTYRGQNHRQPGSLAARSAARRTGRGSGAAR